MTKQDLEQIEKIVSKAVEIKTKPIHGEIALLNRELRDSKMRSMVTEVELRKLTHEVARVDSSVEKLTKTVEKLVGRTSALVVDTNDMKDEIKALGDKIDANVDTTKRQIKEMKEHLGIA